MRQTNSPFRSPRPSVHAGNASRAANNESQRVNDVSLLQSEEVS